MRVAVIGGSGHIGSSLTPMLAEAGLDVTCVSRGLKTPYSEHRAWKNVRRVHLDRIAAEAAGNCGELIAALDTNVVIDLTCYTLESAEQLVDALAYRVDQLIHCGTIWVHGHSVEVPTSEDGSRSPFGDYGVRKAKIEAYLLNKARESGFSCNRFASCGHLVGTGWNPINPQGHFDASVFSEISRGLELQLPNIGMETLHHVHVEDVAHAFLRAIECRGKAVGENFHIVSPAALTLRGYAEGMFSFFKQPAKLRFLPYLDWSRTVSESSARVTWDHISHSPNCSISKARSLIGYSPKYSSLMAVQESVNWLISQGRI